MTDRSQWRPTVTSTVLVVLVTLLTATVLVRAIGVALPATLGGLGAVTLAVVVWTAGWERYRTVGTVLSNLLVLPVGVGLVAATVGTVLVLAGVLFPVSTVAQLPAAVIDLAARAMVVVGAVGAVFGATVTVGTVLDRETAGRAAAGSLKTTLLPLGLGLLLLTIRLLSILESNRVVGDTEMILGDVLGEITAVFFAPPAIRPNVTVFSLLVLSVLLVVRRTLAALPLTEVVDDETVDRAVEAARRVLFWAAVLGALGLPVGLFLDLAFSSYQLRRLLSPIVFDLLTALTTAVLLRSLLWIVIALCVGTLLIVAAVRHLVQTSAERIGATLAPFFAGAVVVVVTAIVAGPVLSLSIDWVANTLPGDFGTQFREIAELLVDSFGALSLVMTVVGLTLLLATATATVLWLVLYTKYLDDRSAGVGIASAALFQTAAFAGVVGVSLPVLFGSLIAAVLVWDVGEFGTTLGQEVGRQAETRRTELTHATGTLAVGGAGAATALAVSKVGVGAITVSGGTVVVALLVGLVGLLALVVALR